MIARPRLVVCAGSALGVPPREALAQRCLRTQYRRAAWYVARILQDAKRAELPVELPARFEMALDLKTARAFGLSLSRSLLLHAEEVIE